eukprot:s533_g2.t1
MGVYFWTRKTFAVSDGYRFEPLGIEDKSLASSLWGPLGAVNLAWLAAVRGSLDEKMVEEFSRRSLKRGAWTQLLPPGKSWLRSQGILPAEEALVDGVYDVHPLWTLLARGLHYSERWRLKVAVPRHINVLEMKSFLRGECLISHKYRHVRHKTPRLPDAEFPSWWNSALLGDFSEYDTWIAEVENDVIKQPFDFSSLGSSFAPTLAADKVKQASYMVKQKLRNEDLLSARRERDHGKDHSVFSSFCSEECLRILISLPRKQFFFKKGAQSFQEAGALDLFSGNCGVARQMVRLGCPWVLSFEWKRGADEDLLDDDVRQKISVLLNGGCFKTFGAAIICCSFSVAVTPPV